MEEKTQRQTYQLNIRFHSLQLGQTAPDYQTGINCIEDQRVCILVLICTEYPKGAGVVSSITETSPYKSNPSFAPNI